MLPNSIRIGLTCIKAIYAHFLRQNLINIIHPGTTPTYPLEPTAGNH
jgi:hypothetical protein